MIKDICGTLASLKSDCPKSGANVGAESRQYEEPTRDPDVWPPPTPVEHRSAGFIAVNNQIIYISSQLYLVIGSISGSAVKWLECWTSDWEVWGSNLTHCTVENGPGQA